MARQRITEVITAVPEKRGGGAVILRKTAEAPDLHEAGDATTPRTQPGTPAR